MQRIDNLRCVLVDVEVRLQEERRIVRVLNSLEMRWWQRQYGVIP